MNQLTFCICAYNAEKYLPETLESLWRQSRKDFDLLVIDDASTDSTKETAEAFFRAHDWQNARVVTLPENGGLAAARHFAEFSVETPYIGFIDADDVAYPELVETLYGYILQHPDCMTASCHCEYISPSSKKIGGGIFIGPDSPEKFREMAAEKKLMFMPPVNVSRVEFIRRAGGRAVEGFPPGKPRYRDMCEDLDLWTRMSDFYTEGKYLIALPQVLMRYRKFAASMSSDTRAMSMRMRHVKSNLLRRRTGLPEQSFIDYLASLTKGQKIFYAYKDWTTNLYKQAGFHYLQKHYLRFAFCFAGAALFNPVYFLQKLRKNVLPSLRRKKQGAK